MLNKNYTVKTSSSVESSSNNHFDKMNEKASIYSMKYETGRNHKWANSIYIVCILNSISSIFVLSSFAFYKSTKTTTNLAHSICAFMHWIRVSYII